MNIEILLKKIESAFSNVPTALTSMRQYHYTDLYAFDDDFNHKEYKSLEKIRVDTSWLEIENSEIEECLCQLSHMNTEDYLYFLPAYLTYACLLYTSPSPRDATLSRMPSSA